MAKTKGLLSTHQVLWWMVFWGFAVNYMIRVNINIAIVEMARRPRNSVNFEHKAACAVPYTNTTMSYNITKINIEPIISTATPEVPLQPGGMNEYEQGLVLGGFFWLFWLTQIPGGVLAARYGTKTVFGLANSIPGIVGMFLPLAASYGVYPIVFVRVLQGFIAGFTWPSMHHLTAQWNPPDRRSKFVTAYLGSSFGAALTFPACGSLMAWAGWPAIFYACGGITIVWAVVWWMVVYDSPAEHPRICPAERAAIEEALQAELAIKSSNKALPIPWGQILTSVPVWMNICAQWGGIWGLFTLLTQAPTYFRHIHGWGIHMTGILSGLPHILRIICALIVSHIGDWLLRTKRMSRTNVRKSATTICNIGLGLSTLALAFSGCNGTVAVFFFVVATALNGAVSTGVLANIVDISPNFASIVMGVCSGVTVFPGFISPYIVGLLTLNNQTTEQWKLVFLISGTMSTVTGILFIMFGDAKVQPWNSPPNEKGQELQPLQNEKETEYRNILNTEKNIQNGTKNI